MSEYFKQVVTSQFQAALAMLKQCIEQCPPEHWEERIANGTFRQIAYHTLFFVDFYLSANEDVFAHRDLHDRGGDERNEAVSLGLSKDETLAYLAICRQKLLDAVSAETAESLTGPSGISYRRFSRGELHLYNLRHVQHHTGQLSAFLRRLGLGADWISSGSAVSQMAASK